MNLRPYQKSACKAIEEAWRYHDRTLLVLPTGTGKTIVFCHLIKKHVHRGKKVLILAHRSELLEQAEQKLKLIDPRLRCAVEKANRSAYGGDGMMIANVVLGSVQTMMRPARLHVFDPGEFDIVIVDEAHHSVSDSYQRILKYFSSAKVLGVTATPDRSDLSELGDYFQELAYEYSLADAISDGYLVPMKAQMIPTKVNLDKVYTVAGDLNQLELSHALEPYLDTFAENIKKYCEGRRTLVFMPLISMSVSMVETLNKIGVNACEINGQTKNRSEILQDFEAGKYDVLCNAMLLTEGWDCPVVDCIVVLRPTKIRSFYAQMIGRGTRPYQNKEDLLILDFLWHTERHSLCQPAHLIASSDEVADKMIEALADSDVLDLEELADQGERDVFEERKNALLREVEAKKNRKARIVDPLDREYSIRPEMFEGYEPNFGWETDKPTEKQLSVLDSAGFDVDEIETAGEASIRIDRIISRRQAGLASYKQIKLLEKYGFQNVERWLFNDASEAIAIISGNRWKVPYWRFEGGVKSYIPKESKDNWKRMAKNIEERDEPDAFDTDIDVTDTYRSAFA